MRIYVRLWRNDDKQNDSHASYVHCTCTVVHNFSSRAYIRIYRFFFLRRLLLLFLHVLLRVSFSEPIGSARVIFVIFFSFLFFHILFCVPFRYLFSLRLLLLLLLSSMEPYVYGESEYVSSWAASQCALCEYTVFVCNCRRRRFNHRHHHRHPLSQAAVSDVRLTQFRFLVKRTLISDECARAHSHTASRQFSISCVIRLYYRVIRSMYIVRREYRWHTSSLLVFDVSHSFFNFNWICVDTMISCTVLCTCRLSHFVYTSVPSMVCMQMYGKDGV